jgi:phage terminase small subunit
MPPLPNPRHEKFAQELASGHSASEACILAGYKFNSGNCIRLKGNERIASRVDELQKRAAARAEVTIASLVSELEEERVEALHRGQISAAVAATMGKAKVTGQIVDRAEIRQSDEFSGMTADQLREFIVTEVEAMGFAVVPLNSAVPVGCRLLPPISV